MLVDVVGDTVHLVQPDYGPIHQELRRKGVTLTLLWEKYQAEFANR